MNVALKQMTQPSFEGSLAYEVQSIRMQDHQEAMAAFGERRKGVLLGRWTRLYRHGGGGAIIARMIVRRRRFRSLP